MTYSPQGNLKKYIYTNKRAKFALEFLILRNAKASLLRGDSQPHVAAESQECRNTSFMNYDYVESVAYVF